MVENKLNLTPEEVPLAKLSADYVRLFCVEGAIRPSRLITSQDNPDC